jgi:HSP90 family molecular chaperone
MQDPSKLSMMMSQKTMEINPRHPIVAELNKRIKDNPEDEVCTLILSILRAAPWTA